MPALTLHNKPLFISLLKAFSHKQQLTIQISPSSFRLSSIDPPYIYLSFENDLFVIDSPAEFTIRLDELLTSLELLETTSVQLDTSFKLVSGDSYVEVPFITPVESRYVEKDIFTTKVVIDKTCLKNMIGGNVTYQQQNGVLIVERYSVGMNERLEIDGEFLESGYLDFFCSNEWVTHAMCFYELIKTVVLCFSDELMSVRFILKGGGQGLYGEIQVHPQEKR